MRPEGRRKRVTVAKATQTNPRYDWKWVGKVKRISRGKTCAREGEKVESGDGGRVTVAKATPSTPLPRQASGQVGASKANPRYDREGVGKVKRISRGKTCAGEKSKSASKRA